MAATEIVHEHPRKGDASPQAVRAPRLIVRPARSEAGSRGVRRQEPVTVGIPLPRGVWSDPRALRLRDGENRDVTLQTRVLETWPDGSIKWVLLDFQASTAPGVAAVFELATGAEPAPVPAAARLRITQSGTHVVVDTGTAVFEVGPTAFPFARVVVAGRPLEGPVGALGVHAADGSKCRVEFGEASIEERGGLRTTVLIVGAIKGLSGEHLLDVIARLHFFAGMASVRVELTLRNPKRAAHRGGYWELGDPGSVSLRDAVVEFSVGGHADVVQCSPESGAALTPFEVPFALYQDSSGGEHWRSANHVNREGRIPVTFRGYRIRAGEREVSALRACPVVAVTGGSRRLTIAMEHFWQNFPKAVEVAADTITLGLFPGQFGDLHEIQGGEQKTYRFAVSFDGDDVSDVPLDWVRSPLLVHADPAWYAETEALPYLWPESDDPNKSYVSLVRSAIEGTDTFEQKREIVDEYGWRHFGDIYADHEAQQHTGPSPLVSHYNNQYDAIAGFAYQFLRTGDVRWWTSMNELAFHVVDIDLYHTEEDKAAYNGGLFWHTAHYKDAGRCSHRSYARASGGGGGGLSAQHNYSTGLLLHYFLTGSAASKEAVLSLATWVVNMDDGRKTVFRWFDRGYTGLATDGPFSHQGPTRAAGNSLNALIDGHRVSGDSRFLEKAEHLIRRSIHPHDDVVGRNLANVEENWSYTVLLEALGRYLDYKAEHGAVDFMYAYARESLLRYAEWMAVHEYPSLDKPEILEFPTETWAAQDMRKSEVFKFAAKHAAVDRRQRLLERADFFFRSSTTTLTQMPTRTLARPVVLLLTRGFMHGYFQQHHDLQPPQPAQSYDFGVPTSFVTQKARAFRRVAILTGTSAGAVGLAAVWWFLG